MLGLYNAGWLLGLYMLVGCWVYIMLVGCWVYISLVPRLSNYCGGGKESLVSIAYACANCPGILG